MLVLLVIVYFVLVCTVCAWLMLANLRTRVLASPAWAAAQLRGLVPRKASPSNGLLHWRTVLWCTLALLATPTLGVWWLGQNRMLDPFDDTRTSKDASVVQSLLQGEQLVPPEPLPPEVFATSEVQSVRPELIHADRRWSRLDNDFTQRLLLVYKIMREEHGYDMVLLEGYRSPERQNELAKMGTHITSAAAWQSYHQYGLAGDSAFIRAGKITISERDPWAMQGYILFGRVAQRAGLVWGGNWKNADLGHVELRHCMANSKRTAAAALPICTQQ
jgi:peptidoglycan LD-endopeptidase CwlK